MLDAAGYEEFKAYVEPLTGNRAGSRKIRAIGVNPLYHGTPKRLLKIGQFYADLEPGDLPRQIIAIFEATLFCVCTPERGE